MRHTCGRRVDAMQRVQLFGRLIVTSRVDEDGRGCDSVSPAASAPVRSEPCESHWRSLKATRLEARTTHTATSMRYCPASSAVGADAAVGAD